MTITSIEQAKKREERVNIFLDNEFWVGLDKNQLIQFGLHKGKTISPDEKRFIEEESSFFKLIERVINLTMIRPRSKFEVVQYLTLKKSVEEPLANKVITHLEEKGFLSDEEFAKWYINNRQSHGFHGRNKISAELAKKGVAPSIVKELLKSSENEEENIAKIQKLFEKIKGKIKSKDKYEYKNKIFQRILSRGYSYDEVSKALKELL